MCWIINYQHYSKHLNLVITINQNTMIRITVMSGVAYGVEFDDMEDELENIEGFLNEGTPVILVASLDELDRADGFTFKSGQVAMVEPED